MAGGGLTGEEEFTLKITHATSLTGLGMFVFGAILVLSFVCIRWRHDQRKLSEMKSSVIANLNNQLIDSTKAASPSKRPKRTDDMVFVRLTKEGGKVELLGPLPRDAILVPTSHEDSENFISGEVVGSPVVCSPNAFRSPVSSSLWHNTSIPYAQETIVESTPPSVGQAKRKGRRKIARTFSGTIPELESPRPSEEEKAATSQERFD